jgi:alpha-beta hydrolase superfamily lysophospholipase
MRHNGVQLVHGAGAASRLWNEFMARYHELGYTPIHPS